MKYILSPQNKSTTAVYCLPLMFPNLITQATAAATLVSPLMFSMFNASGPEQRFQCGCALDQSLADQVGATLHITPVPQAAEGTSCEVIYYTLANVTELISRQDEMCNLSECLCRRSNIYSSSWEQRSKRKRNYT